MTGLPPIGRRRAADRDRPIQACVRRRDKARQIPFAAPACERRRSVTRQDKPARGSGLFVL